jgi:ABC-type multidrug transport system ATPase subunit
MGSSGAGKTTMMDVIAGRKTVGRTTGAITINGRPKDPESFARLTGYVEQTDVHVPLQTVGEALRFAAALRLPAGFSSQEREELVRVVAGLVELGPLEGCLVGTPGEAFVFQCWGGERGAALRV